MPNPHRRSNFYQGVLGFYQGKGRKGLDVERGGAGMLRGYKGAPVGSVKKNARFSQSPTESKRVSQSGGGRGQQSNAFSQNGERANIQKDMEGVGDRCVWGFWRERGKQVFPGSTAPEPRIILFHKRGRRTAGREFSRRNRKGNLERRTKEKEELKHSPPFNEASYEGGVRKKHW